MYEPIPLPPPVTSWKRGKRAVEQSVSGAAHGSAGGDSWEWRQGTHDLLAGHAVQVGDVECAVGGGGCRHGEVEYGTSSGIAECVCGAGLLPRLLAVLEQVSRMGNGKWGNILYGHCTRTLHRVRSLLLWMCLSFLLTNLSSVHRR